MPISLLELPRELIEHIIISAEPFDVAALSQTCRQLRALIYEAQDQLIWRELFLSQIFDDPRKCIAPNGSPLAVDTYDWKGEVQRRLRAATIITKPDVCKPGELHQVLETLVSMIVNIPPSTSNYALSEISTNLAWIKTQLKDGLFLETLTSLSPEEEQLLARLHAYFGLTLHDLQRHVRVETRAYVYDMRNYVEVNNWGPFMQDASGRVNWVHVRAIQHVMSMHAINLDGFVLGSSVIIDTPMSLPFCQSQYDVTGFNISKEDWAGVEGRWQCSFCFIDHRDLLLYNQPTVPERMPRDKSLFESPDFVEVFRYLRVDMHITNTEADPAHPNRPRLSFVGCVGPHQTIVGSVFMTSEDQIRWKFLSGGTFSSEGVQIGSVQSVYGVLGAWTTVFHDEGDPIGPFWLRKIHTAGSTQEEENRDDRDLEVQLELE